MNYLALTPISGFCLLLWGKWKNMDLAVRKRELESQGHSSWIGLPDLANKHPGCPIKLGFHVKEKTFLV